MTKLEVCPTTPPSFMKQQLQLEMFWKKFQRVGKRELQKNRLRIHLEFIICMYSIVKCHSTEPAGDITWRSHCLLLTKPLDML